jgi:hypothetical protein
LGSSHACDAISGLALSQAPLHPCDGCGDEVAVLLPARSLAATDGAPPQKPLALGGWCEAVERGAESGQQGDQEGASTEGPTSFGLRPEKQGGGAQGSDGSGGGQHRQQSIMGRVPPTSRGDHSDEQGKADTGDEGTGTPALQARRRWRRRRWRRWRRRWSWRRRRWRR